MQHLARAFNSVALNTCAGKTHKTRLAGAATCTRGNAVHYVSELVKECHHLAVVQQRGLIRRWFGKVAQHGHRWQLQEKKNKKKKKTQFIDWLMVGLGKKLQKK